LRFQICYLIEKLGMIEPLLHAYVTERLFGSIPDILNVVREG
jgi:hypothetical protein